MTEAVKPQEPDEPRLRARVNARIKLAEAALLWEELWPALWPAVLVAGVFLGLALFDVLPMLPGWAHGIVLVAFACLFAAALFHARTSLRLPGRRAAERRIELASALRNRPLAALEDHPAEPRLTPAQSELWHVHRERMAAAVKRLRVGFPHAGLAKRDPYGLRVILALVLIVAAVDARGDALRRLTRAVTPHFPTMAASAPALDVWVAPPDYTGLPTVVLAKSAADAGAEAGTKKPPSETVHVPSGSTLFAQVHGGRSTPRLKVAGGSSEFAPLGGDSYQARTVLRTPGRVVIEQNGLPLAAWTLAVVPDEPPAISLKDKPGQSERGALRLAFHVADDYGVVEAKAAITRAPSGAGEEEGAGAAPIEVPLPLPGGRVTDASNVSYHDLTASPWAGTPVTMRLEAKDGAGQTGTSDPVTLVLPERKFHNEVARAIVTERKNLTLHPNGRHLVASALAEIAEEPSRFHGDIVVYMALNSAIGRLLLEREPSAIPEVQRLLWDTALRLEDDGASLAARDLRKIEQELRDALAKGADAKEIERLLDQLEQAMNNYLDALTRNAEAALMNQPPGEEEFRSESAQNYRPQDLHDLLDKARELAQMGDREAARQMLSKLQDILENLRTPRQAELQSQREARAALQKLQDLIKRQQDLLDRTYQNAKPQAAPGQMPQPGQREGQGQPPGTPGKPGQKGGAKGPEGQDDAAEQEALRKELGDAMLKFGDMLGKIPNELGRAERAMREAAEALKQGQPGEAVSPETKAVDQLQQGMESVRQELAKKDEQNQPGGTEPGPQTGQGKDPLGRPLADRGGRGAAKGDVRIPEQMELRRAREILDELRKRAGEPGRPEIERDYIDRLLPQF